LTKHEIYFGDSRKLNKMSDKCVHLIITSPPYWQLKDYGTETQIGFNDSYEDYINNLNLVWQECNRVLMDGCRLCINVGDQFARSVYYGRYKVIPIRDEIIRYCETIGLDFMGSIIWQKVTTCNTTGGASIMGSFPYPRNGIVKVDYEYILLFKKQGKAPVISKETKEKSKLSNDEWNEYFNGHWYFPGAKQDKHIAMFPEELPKRLIKMFSFVGETVFDPFMGSGTTSLAAANLERNSVGYEINQDFKEIMEHKVLSSNSLEHSCEIKFGIDDNPFDKMIEVEKLFYHYKDPVKIMKKVDPKALTFGSKIDKDTPEEIERTYLVKEVVSPEKLLLDTGVIVKLLGVKQISGKENDATQFLIKNVKGKRIYLKYDIQKFYKDNLLVYAYLENRTFINKHYLRTGLVELDNLIPISKKITI
jgi:DNA modification methylase